MEVSPLANIDRLASRSTFRGFTGSPCGIIGTLIFLTTTIYMNAWVALSFAAGNYFQSSFETQASAYETLQVPYDLRMALVFYNKTSGAVANHTLLNTMFDTRIYSSSNLGTNFNLEGATLCNGTNKGYFADAINPVTLPDCFIFTEDRPFLYSYVPNVGVPFSQVGFNMAFTCLNAFFCRTGGSAQTAVQNNLVAIFTNFSMTFYFSTRVLQPDGTSRHQVYNVSSGDFTNPATISASIDSEILVSNITMDYSIMPWKDMKYVSNLAYYGFQRATPRTATTIFSPLPRINVIASNYLNKILRYYKKEDWLLGVIGGSAFLIYICLWILCHPINQSLFRIHAAEELLLQVNHVELERPSTLQKFKRAFVPYSYILLRYWPFYTNTAINTLTSVMDITTIIKQLKVTERNLFRFIGNNLYDKYRVLRFNLEQQPTELRQPQQERIEVQVPQQLQPRLQPEGQVRQSLNDQSSEKMIPGGEGQTFNGLIQQPQLSEQPKLRLQPTDSLPMLEKMDSFSYLDARRHRAGNKKNTAQPLLQQQKNDPRYELDQKENEDFEFQGVQISIPEQKVEKMPSQTEKIDNIPQEKLESFIKMDEQDQGGSNKHEKSMKNQDLQIMSINKEENNRALLKNQDLPIENKISQQLQIEPTNAIILRNHQEIQPQRDPQQDSRDQAQLLGLHKGALEATKNSSNTSKVLGNFPTVMHLTNNVQNYETLLENQSYDNDDEPMKPEPSSKIHVFWSRLVYYLRLLDFYSVKIQFNADAGNHSWLGVLFTFIIIALPCLQIANMLQFAGTYQVYVSKDFLQAKDISYTLTTGKGYFRPILCTNYNANTYLTGFGQTVRLLFYTYTKAQGFTYYNPINMPSNSRDELGITPDSLYNSLDTSLCWKPPENMKIAMGGYNTDKEAYFGYRFEGYCGGTEAYCNSIRSTTNANLLSFLNTGSNTFTFYTPINQYSNAAGSVYTGQVQPQVIREGSSRFSTTNAIEETVYVDRIQLIDAFRAHFVGKSPVIEETLCTTRYQLNEVAKEVIAANPYYELRVRPSQNLTKVYLVGSSLNVLLGTIGGVFFLCFVTFHLFGKCYNGYNVRSKLAEDLYNERGYQSSAISKLYMLFIRPFYWLFCKCFCCSYKPTREQRVDEKMKEDLNAIEICKTVSSCARLSAMRFKTLQEKELAMVYFKERADMAVKEEVIEVQEDDFLDDEINGDESSVNQSTNQIANQDHPQTLIESNLNSKNKFDADLSDSQRELMLADMQETDMISLEEPYRDQSFIQKSKTFEWLARFDIYHADAEFSLNGQWRVRSIFGCLLSLLSIAFVFLIFLYYVIDFAKGMDRRISYERGMVVDPEGSPPLQLNVSSNFRAAFGFYTKPSFSFLNMSSYNINGPNSTLAFSVFQDSQVWRNNRISITSTRYDLIPCPSNYFDDFFSPNEDPSYYSSVVNGFCLPYNLTLNLSAQTQNNTQYFRLSVYNKTAAGSSSLQTLTSSFVLGIYMTVPIVNLQKGGFSYQVQQIRPNSEVTSRAYSVNVTLTRQTITFTTPNYTTNTIAPTLTTYNYIEDRAYQITNVNSATSLARVYNISFTHSGLGETYTVSYSHATELLGYAGGITLVVISVLGCIAQSFNTYYKEYLIGQKLYLLWPSENKKSKKSKQKKAMERKEKEREERNPLMNKEDMQRFQSFNEFNEYQVWKAWLLSFLGKLTKSYDWNTTLSKIQMLRSKALEDLDFFNFYKRLMLLRDTINSREEYRLAANQEVPLTSIYSKTVVQKTQRHEYDSYHPFFINVLSHRLSSRDQWRLLQAEDKLLQVFDQKYLQRVLTYNPAAVVSAKSGSEQSRPEVMRKQASSVKSRRRLEPDVEVAVQLPLGLPDDNEYAELPQASKESMLRDQHPQERPKEKRPQQESAQEEFDYNIQDDQSSSSKE